MGPAKKGVSFSANMGNISDGFFSSGFRVLVWFWTEGVLKIWAKRLTQLMNHGGVCRTAPATLVLLISINKDRERKEKKQCKWWSREFLPGERRVFLQSLNRVLCSPQRIAPFYDGRIFGRTVSKKVLNGFLTDGQKSS